MGNNGDQGDNFTNEYFPDMSGNGRSWAGNQFNMDGITVTSNVTTGTLNWAPNPDAIEELTVETNTFKVDQGIGSSVVVNMITKSGGNQFHGSGKYLFNNQDMWGEDALHRSLRLYAFQKARHQRNIRRSDHKGQNIFLCLSGDPAIRNIIWQKMGPHLRPRNS